VSLVLAMSPNEDNVYLVADQTKPVWNLFSKVAPYSSTLSQAADFSGVDLRPIWEKDAEAIPALLKTAEADNSDATKYVMFGIYETLRADVTLFDCFDKHLSNLKILSDLSLSNTALQEDAADKVAWLHSALIGNLSHRFAGTDGHAHVEGFVSSLEASKCSRVGKLEAIANLLKSPDHRQLVWTTKDGFARLHVESVSGKDTQMLYKCVFAYWMLSFEGSNLDNFKVDVKAVSQLKEILSVEVKVEKVVRLALLVIENFLGCKQLTETIASSTILESIQALEYEKWRDADLYTKIQSVSQSVSQAVSEVSNFQRYLKELDTGKLEPGPFHKSKFWAENYSQVTLAVVHQLTGLVTDSKSNETVAMACSDIGEIAVLHRDGKEMIRKANAKDAVMQKMAEDADKMVRREALLCCQKIMLNKWQDISQK